MWMRSHATSRRFGPSLDDATGCLVADAVSDGINVATSRLDIISIALWMKVEFQNSNVDDVLTLFLACLLGRFLDSIC